MVFVLIYGELVDAWHIAAYSYWPPLYITLACCVPPPYNGCQYISIDTACFVVKITPLSWPLGVAAA